MANEYKTLSIGTIFTYNGNKYKVCKDEDGHHTCNKCAFNGINCDTIKGIRGNCIFGNRIDNIQVYYEQINNETMNKDNDTKKNVVIPIFNEDNSLSDIKIECPKGYIIDVKHTDLSKRIIRFKKDNITLEDIPSIIRDDIKINAFISKSSTYYNYLNKLKAIATLIDIAKYYNKDWKPDWRSNKEYKYRINYNRKYDEYCIYYSFFEKESIIYFKNKEDARSVIDNPNFRYILDSIYKY